MMTIILMMEAEAAGISETSVYFYWTTPRNIPEGFRLYTPRRENLKSYLKLWMVVLPTEETQVPYHVTSNELRCERSGTGQSLNPGFSVFSR
jgi:hypothetical protein